MLDQSSRKEKIQSMASDSSGNSGPLDGGGGAASRPSRYESQKRRDWNTFCQYLRNHRPPLALSRCSGAHVLEFLRYLDQFGKTKVHVFGCPFFGHPHPPAPCPCPLKQAWGSLDALVGRLRAAYEENGGQPENNPFGARAVRLYLREVRDLQAKARGVSYEKKKRKRPPPLPQQGHGQPPPADFPMMPVAAATAMAQSQHQVSDLNVVMNTGYPHQLHEQYYNSMALPPAGASGGEDDLVMADSSSLIQLQVLN